MSEINKGRLSFTDGRLYEGEIENGKPNGKGKLTYADGTVEEGRFENNKFIEGENNG